MPSHIALQCRYGKSLTASDCISRNLKHWSKKKRELLLPLFRSSFKPFDDLPQITLHVYYIVPHEKREAVGGFSFQKLMLGATF